MRAIAVLSVVLYHFGVPFLDGGFVGVDIFFVISGFLIGGLLWKELQSTGRIALGRFYMRRIRRLAPAYFAMAITSAVAAWFILLPFEFREFGKSLIAATVWLSNVQFWREAGYFDIGADSKVLLHTWSLSVEEQFYVFLPLLMIVLAFLKHRLTMVLALIWALSLAACVALTPSQPSATFFLFPFRAWELLTGVLLAIWMQNGDRPTAPWLSWAGLALVLISIFWIDSAGFPGWQAILPVAGTMLMLAGGAGKTPVNAVLSMKGPVFIGLISYSLYLWHWPVLVLSRYWRDGYGSAAEAAMWLALAVVLAILSWALIERPLRRTKRIAAPAFLTGTVAAALAVIGFGGLAMVRDGVPSRFGEDTRGHIAASDDFFWRDCFAADDGPLAGIEVCPIGPDGDPEVIVWGDSHLRAIMGAMGDAAIEAGTPGLIIWHAGCPPLFGIDKDESAATPAQNRDCSRANDTLREAFPQITSAERILLVGRWSYYAEGGGTGQDAHNVVSVTGRRTDGTHADTGAEVFKAAMALTLQELGQTFDEVHILRQVPEVPFYSSRDVARGLAHGRLTAEDAMRLFTVGEETLASRMANVEMTIYPLVEDGQAQLIDTWPTFCPERCSVMVGGAPVYFDNNHLTHRGATLLRPLFTPFLTGTTGDG